MKSETSFRVFFLKQHRKNSLKNIFFPSESVLLDFSFWPQGHRTWQNAHCALLQTATICSSQPSISPFCRSSPHPFVMFYKNVLSVRINCKPTLCWDAPLPTKFAISQPSHAIAPLLEPPKLGSPVKARSHITFKFHDEIQQHATIIPAVINNDDENVCGALFHWHSSRISAGGNFDGDDLMQKDDEG